VLQIPIDVLGLVSLGDYVRWKALVDVAFKQVRRVLWRTHLSHLQQVLPHLVFVRRPLQTTSPLACSCPSSRLQRVLARRSLPAYCQTLCLCTLRLSHTWTWFVDEERLILLLTLLPLRIELQSCIVGRLLSKWSRTCRGLEHARRSGSGRGKCRGHYRFEDWL